MGRHACSPLRSQVSMVNYKQMTQHFECMQPNFRPRLSRARSYDVSRIRASCRSQASKGGLPTGGVVHRIKTKQIQSREKLSPGSPHSIYCNTAVATCAVASALHKREHKSCSGE